MTGIIDVLPYLVPFILVFIVIVGAHCRTAYNSLRPENTVQTNVQPGFSSANNMQQNYPSQARVHKIG